MTFEVSKDQTTWSTISTQVTDGSSNAAFFYRPSDNRFYRVTFAGSGDLGAAMSPVVRVVVRQLVFIRPTGCTNSGNPCDISRGKTITFTAIARPNRPELPTQQATFTVQHKSGSTWVTVATQTVVVSKSTGEANLAVTFNSTGQYRHPRQPRADPGQREQLPDTVRVLLGRREHRGRLGPITKRRRNTRRRFQFACGPVGRSDATPLQVGEELGARPVARPEQAQHGAVVMIVPGLRTPRMTAQRCVASTTTPTPCGARRSSRKSAICCVRRSWTCSRRAYISTMRGIFESPMTRPRGM